MAKRTNKAFMPNGHGGSFKGHINHGFFSHLPTPGQESEQSNQPICESKSDSESANSSTHSNRDLQVPNFAHPLSGDGLLDKANKLLEMLESFGLEWYHSWDLAQATETEDGLDVDHHKIVFSGIDHIGRHNSFSILLFPDGTMRIGG